MGPHGHIWTQRSLPRVPVMEGEGVTSEESALRSLVRSWGASIRLAGAPALVACLAEDARLASSGEGIVGPGLGPFVGVQILLFGRRELSYGELVVNKRDPVRVVPLVDASASHLVL